MKYIFIIFILFLSPSIKADINKISENDFKKVKALIEELILEHDFAYTIFGSKPMSLADIGLDISDFSVLKKIDSELFLEKRKSMLNAWYKYKDEINLKDFIFLDKEKDLFSCLVIVLINKKNMLALLKENEDVFKKKLGISFNPELFLEKIEKREVSLAESINHNYGLLGIMLGYGVRNSMLFQERLNLLKEIEKRKWLLSSENEFLKQYQNLEFQFQDFNDFEEFPLVRPLYFGADLNHPETINLKKKYEIDRKKIEELMRQPNFIDRVLERLQEK